MLKLIDEIIDSYTPPDGAEPSSLAKVAIEDLQTIRKMVDKRAKLVQEMVDNNVVDGISCVNWLTWLKEGK